MKSVAVAMFLVALSGRLSVVNETGKLGGVWITSNEFVADQLDVPNIAYTLQLQLHYIVEKLTTAPGEVDGVKSVHLLQL